MLADNFFNLIQSKWAFLLILAFLLIVGMFVDMTPALIMLVPKAACRWRGNSTSISCISA